MFKHYSFPRGVVPRPRAARATLVALLGLGVCVTGSQAASGASPAQSASSSARSVRTVTLPTGDQVTVTSQGSQVSYEVNGGSARGGFFTYQGPNGDEYVVPSEAEPYLGRQLSPALFDVTAAATAQGRIPVTLDFTADAASAAPPGVTFTTVMGRTATGYLTTASGAAFAKALRAQLGADERAGVQPGTGVLFGGLTEMAPAGTTLTAGPADAASNAETSNTARSGPSGPATRTASISPLGELTVDAASLSGAVAGGASGASPLVMLDDVDAAGFVEILPIVDGTDKVYLAPGNYSLLAYYEDVDASGNITAMRTAEITNLTMPSGGGAVSENVDESAASSQITVTPPAARPAQQEYLETSLDRVGAGGFDDRLTMIADSVQDLYVSPQPAALHGESYFQTQWGGDPGGGTDYRYDLEFGSASIPVDESHVVDPAGLATVDESVYSDPAGGLTSLTGNSEAAGVLDPYTGGNYFIISSGLDYTGNYIDYVGTTDGSPWLMFMGLYQTDPLTYNARQVYVNEWGHGPLTPQFSQHSGGYLVCSACGEDGYLSFGMNQFTDSEADQTGPSGFVGTAQLTIYRNGSIVAQEPNISDSVTLPDSAARIELDATDDMSGVAGISQSTQTDTTVAFNYEPEASPANSLPSDYFCPGPTGPLIDGCQVLPVMNLSYDIATDLQNTSHSLVQTMNLAVSHLTYDGFGSQAPITSARVQVSFNGGSTWEQAILTPAGPAGHYLAQWPNPPSAAGSSPMLRTTATDAAGGTITQTVAAAYTLASTLS